ncbi:MAG: HAD family hydrolase [Bdellovibrionaceae bacterium]|nr:HAD family hydrolase [Pseudobdellovibrionaceae bacterium]
MSNKIDSIIFDLDGTLWDTCESCAIGWNNVILRNNIDFRKITADDVRRVAGKPHHECIQNTFIGLSESQINILVDETATEDILMVEKHGGELYEGVVEGLKSLSSSVPLFIVSNCQDGYIDLFTNYSNTSSYFKDHECWGSTEKQKHENIRLIIERNQINNPTYIGDTEGDRIAATKASVPFIYVDYGFGKLSHDVYFSSFRELTHHLEGLI